MTFLKSCKLHCQNETWWVEQRICFLPPSAIERNHHIHQQIKQVWCSKLPACKLMPLNKCSPEKKHSKLFKVKGNKIEMLSFPGCSVVHIFVVLCKGISPGEGHGNPLQYSCLENLMDRGAWQATVHGVLKSWIRLKWLNMHVQKNKGFPHGASGKEHTCQCRRYKTREFDPWVRKISWRRAW